MNAKVFDACVHLPVSTSPQETEVTFAHTMNAIFTYQHIMLNQLVFLKLSFYYSTDASNDVVTLFLINYSRILSLLTRLCLS